MSYVTKCPKCGADLAVVSCTVVSTHILVEPDGFSFTDASHCDTDDVVVHCCRNAGSPHCNYVGTLTDDEEDA